VRPEDENVWDNEVRFVAFRVPFNDLSSELLAVAFEEIFEAKERKQAPEYRVTPKTQRELYLEGVDEEEIQRQESLDGDLSRLSYSGNNIGGKYLRAPDIFFTILEKGRGKLVRLGEVAEVHGYIHDNNTGRQFPKTFFLKSLREAEAILLEKTSPGVCLYGVRKEGKSRLVAPALIARTFGDRLFVIWNRGRILAKEFYKVIPTSDDETIILALLNSMVTLLSLELEGFTNLGSGGLKHSIQTITRIILSDPKLFSSDYRPRLLSAFNRLSSRRVRSIFEELGFTLCKTRHCNHPEHPYEYVKPENLTLQQVQRASPDRFELDSVVFDVLGLTNEERLQVYQAVAQLVKDRLLKAKSVSPEKV